MSVIVTEGFWVHKTKEESRALEVVAVDNHRKMVTLVDQKTMTFGELTANYLKPSLVGSGRNLLGGLDGENDLPRHVEHPNQVSQKFIDAPHSLEERIISNDVKERRLTIEDDTVCEKLTMVAIGKPSDEVATLLAPALKMASGKQVVVESDIKVEFDFDINKITSMAKVFEIDSKEVAKAILNTKEGQKALVSVLESIIKDLM